MHKQFDLIGIGECLIELFEEAPHVYWQSVAGDVFNSLFYASRLGLKTGFISTFGSDNLTKNIIEVMDREGIDRSCTSISKTKTNGLYLISTNKSGEPHYSFWRSDSAAREMLQGLDNSLIVEYILSAKYFHVSAIGLAVMQDHDKFLTILKEVHGKTVITFDTNFRKGLWSDLQKLVQFLEQGASYIDILFVSDTDDQNIFGSRTSKIALQYYSSLGYRTIIFRQGPNEVLVQSDQNTFSVPPVKNIKVVDATAAGDAFNAGFISAQLGGKDIRESVVYANKCAARVIVERGALTNNFRMI